MGIMGRPKAEIHREKRLECRLTNFEFEKIEKISKKLGISKTEAILKGIDLLERDKPKKYKNLNKNSNGKNSEGIIEGEIVMFDKN